MIGIYRITNLINGRFYIGQSRNIEERFAKHKREKLKDNDLYTDLRKHGVDNFIFEVLEECEIGELDSREDYYLKLLNPKKYGYNKTNEVIPSNDVDFQVKNRERLRRRNEENWKKPEYRKKMSESSRKQQLERLKDEAYYKEKCDTLKKATDKMKKTVYQYDLNDNLIKAHEGVRVAGRATNIDSKSISKVCKGERKTAGGFKWSYHRKV